MKSFTRRMYTHVAVLLGLFAVHHEAMAVYNLELIGTYPNITAVRGSGNFNGVPSSSTESGGNYFYHGLGAPGFNQKPGIIIADVFGTVKFVGPPAMGFSFRRQNIVSSCPKTASAWRSHANSLLASIVIPITPSGATNITRDEITFGYWCNEVANGVVYANTLWVSTPGPYVEVVNPPDPASVCTLNNQNLNYSFSSTSLNVNGTSQSRNLTVSCTTGTAKNYQLRLTGTNATGGRLNFGNGVSAQMDLDGTNISANGAAMNLNNLASRSITVKATLSGTASTSGTTNANGVLVLDAL